MRERKVATKDINHFSLLLRLLVLSIYFWRGRLCPSESCQGTHRCQGLITPEGDGRFPRMLLHGDAEWESIDLDSRVGMAHDQRQCSLDTLRWLVVQGALCVGCDLAERPGDVAHHTEVLV